jgi:integrase
MEHYKLCKLHDFGGDLAQRWYVQYYFLHPETRQFKKFREWISSRLLTKQARYLRARDIQQAINAKLRQGFNPFLAADNKLLSTAIAELLERRAKTVGRQRLNDLKVFTRSFMKWLEGRGLAGVTATEISAGTAQAYADELLIRGLAARSINNQVNGLGSVFNELKRRGMTEGNPFALVERLRTREADITFITNAERLLLKDRLSVEHPPLWAAALLVYYCFMRPATIVRLQVRDVNFEENFINVKASRVKNGRNQQRTMHHELVEALSALSLEKYAPDFYIFSNGKNLVPAAHQVISNRVSEAWREVVIDGYGISKHIYDLKATGNGLASDAGIPPRDIQLQNGHQSLETTQKYLERVSRKASAAFLEKMPAF